MKTIQPGQTLSARSGCDFNCVFTCQVIDRRGQWATVETQMQGRKRVKVRTDYAGQEYVLALGQYSMAPQFQP
jgi:hypothetical protein